MIDVTIQRRLHGKLLLHGLPINSFRIRSQKIADTDVLLVTVYKLDNVKPGAPEEFEGYTVVYVETAS